MGWTLIAYDIREDARRNRVSKWLKSRGYRVQYSVFLVHSVPVEVLRDALNARIEPEDALWIQPLNKACMESAVRLGCSVDPTQRGVFRLL